jgi:hypothetical protein
MAALLDNVRFTPTAGGTTDWTYFSAVTGYQSPAAAGVVNGTKYKYFAISSDSTQWEIGEGAYNTSTGVLPRTTVLSNSAGTGTASGQSGAGSKINFSTAPTVAIVAVKEDLISIEEANSFTSAQQAQARSNIGAAIAASPLTMSLSADVALTNTSQYFDGPSVAQGTVGTWFASGAVELFDSTAADFSCKLWDGTTVMDSARFNFLPTGNSIRVSFSGIITNPSGNIRISCKDSSQTTGKIQFNASGNGKDSTITAIRVG